MDDGRGDDDHARARTEPLEHTSSSPSRAAATRTGIRARQRSLRVRAPWSTHNLDNVTIVHENLYRRNHGDSRRYNLYISLARVKDLASPHAVRRLDDECVRCAVTMRGYYTRV